jgi:hypothetical protein
LGVIAFDDPRSARRPAKFCGDRDARESTVGLFPAGGVNGAALCSSPAMADLVTDSWTMAIFVAASCQQAHVPILIIDAPERRVEAWGRGC